ncbi:flagellin [Arthrobacter sp. Hiyo8]|uniref:flagellin N-terminal helical domain-containing protein n=1 Tax=Arthrobacter sp. Hiyo1 TaxID=1588020 RepID=UPI00068392D3|nr:flagellin [Arthrobacter sp. Hiyo1]BAS14127.1 flagellin [Arthrobacter sp. Hiyo8]GAP58717.1 flagellin [Arthrobacter sp. Hiyo1]
MGMAINTNLMANNAYGNLNRTQNDVSKSMEKLSSGLRINRAADDAAGLAISEGLKSQVSGSAVAARNAQDGISVIQTTEGALTEVHSILQRMRDLAVQGSNDTNNTASRAAIKGEGDSLGKELDRLTQSTQFNGIDLLKGAAGNSGASLNIQVGTGGSANDKIAINLGDVATAVGTGATGLSGAAGAAGFKVDTSANAQLTIAAVDTAIAAVSAQRADLGATQNRLEHATKTLQVSGENLQAAESRITDTDMASEMVKYTKANIMSQAGTAMLAQANQSGQGVLSLLR